MANVLDMKDIRYINLFGQVTRISTRHCFMYNEAIVFAVPKHLVSKAIGENGKNVKRISMVTKKKIKVIPTPMGESHIEEFVKAVVSPVSFNGLEVTENEIVITAGSQNKAALLGRNKRRFAELKEIVWNFFKKELRIV